MADAGAPPTEGFDGAFEGDIFAQARIGDEFIFDEGADSRRLVGEATVVEVLENAFAVARHQIARDLGQTHRRAPVVEFSANQA